MADDTVSVTSFPGGPPIAPAARLTVCLLGPPEVFVNGEPALELRGQKILALLGYLVLESGRAHRRDTLAALLWPDQPDEQAFQNLRQTLTRLRRGLDDAHADPPHLLIEPHTIRFNRSSDYWLDVEAFRALLSSAEQHAHRRLEVCPACLSQLTRAAGLYRGELLAHVQPAGSFGLDEWLLLEREELGQHACSALRGLADARLARGDARGAAAVARRLLHLEPWDEAALRRLMDALAQGGSRNAALRTYQAFRRSLRAELGVEPEDETVALATALRKGAPRGRQRAMVAPPPSPATPLIGRQGELQAISDLLAVRGPRLLTVHGAGGCGKTRLALEIAGLQSGFWRDGVWFVPLNEALTTEALIGAVATAVGAGPDTAAEMQPLLDFLRPKEGLLILDGFEHLAASASFLDQVLRWAPEIHMLVTSRTRLGLASESALPLGGLSLPHAEPAAVSAAEGAGAVRLFVQAARRVAPAFRLTAQNVAPVARACLLVEGLPLGIELAAAWVRLYDPQQIAQQIEANLDFLHVPGADASERHGSLRGAFDYSLGLLSEAQRALLLRLSVFRGFTVDAAAQVAGADPVALDAFLDRSLVQPASTETHEGGPRRFNLHLALREYAAERLSEAPCDETATRSNHARYYLSFLRTRAAAVHGENAKPVQNEIQSELGNVRAAWRWAAAAGLRDELTHSLEPLAEFYSLKGYLREGETLMSEAAAAIPAGEAPDRHLASRLQVQQASFLRRLGEFDAAIRLAEDVAGRTMDERDALSEAMACWVWGEALWRQGDYASARGRLERGLAIARGLAEGDKVLAGSLNSLAGVCWRQADYAGARICLEECLQLPSHAGKTRLRSAALGNLGVVAVEQGDYPAAKSAYRQALEIERAIGEREGESISLTNLGNLSLYLGDYAEAEACYHQALAIHREIGARQNEAWTVGNVALLAHYRGDHEAAQGYAREALRTAQEIGDRALEATMWLELGHALLGLARPDAAAEAYRAALALRRELNQPNRAVEALAGLVAACLARGDGPQALANVEEILSHLASGPSALDGTLSPFQVYLTCYEVLEAVRDPRAAGLLAAGHDLLQGRAARIADEKLRRSFLDNVAVHRKLMEAVTGRAG